jgi:NAD-dependent dihydropyrimidine dehydrogenase PreA subunit
MNGAPQIDTASCKQAPGSFAPVIDRNRCEGKGDCVSVCPKSVFVLGVLPASDRGSLSFAGKLKGFAHGWKQAFMPNVGACEACGLCVAACPENAIILTRK